MNARPRFIPGTPDPSSTQGGNALILIILLLLVAAVGLGVLFYIARSEALDPGLLDQTMADSADKGRGDDRPGAGAKKWDGEKRKGDKGVKPAKGDKNKNRNKGKKGGNDAIELIGTVLKRGTDEPISGAFLRFVPRARRAFDSVLGEPSLVEDTVELSQLPQWLRGPIGDSTTARSTLDGSFAFTLGNNDLPAWIIAGGEGLETVLESIDAASAGTIEVTIELGPGSEVSGLVIERETGMPAVGMEVIATPSQDVQGGFLAGLNVTGPRVLVREDGTYQMSGLAEREYKIVPKSGGTEFLNVPMSQAKRVLPRPGQPAHDIDFEVLRGGTIEGRVSDSAGTALHKVVVTASPTSFLDDILGGSGDALAELGSHVVQTDKKGEFKLIGIPLGREYVIVANSDDHAAGQSDGVSLTREQRSRRVEITLSNGATIRGTVRTPEGRPAADVTVLASPDYTGIIAGNITQAIASTALNTQTDAEGRFVLDHVPVGTFSIRAGDVNSFSALGGGGVELEVTGEEEINGVELVLVGATDSEDGPRIVGIVVDDTGTGIEDVRLETSVVSIDFTKMESTRTDAEGKFEIRGFDGRSVTIEATKQGYVRQVISVSSDPDAIRIVMPRPASVSGIVRTPDGSAPGVPFQVSWNELDDQETMDNLDVQGFLPTLSDNTKWIDGKAGGEFALPAVPSTRVEIIARASGFADGSTGEMFLAPGQEVTGVEIYLTAGATVTGRVMVQEGGVAAHAGIAMNESGGDEAAEAYAAILPGLSGGGESESADVNGVYRIHPVNAGKYKIVASLSGYAPSAPTTISVGGGEVVQVPDIVLVRGGTIQGTVTRLGEPRSGMMVQIVGSGPMRMDTTGADGTYSLDSLAPGEYMVAVTDMSGMLTGGGMSYKSTNVDIGDGEIETVDFDFGHGFTVRGKITNFSPGAAMMATLRIPGGPGPEDYDPLDMQAAIAAGKFQRGVGMIQPDGTFMMSDIEPGEYILEVPRLPDNIMDMAAYSRMDRTPSHRSTIRIGEENKEVEIEIDLTK